MPVFLDENYMAADPDIVGFPHLLLCMGFVALVDDGTAKTMWGVHLTDVEHSQWEFKMFAGEMLKTVDPKQIKVIYGSCNRVVRYNGQTENAVWKKEMMSFAGMLGFNGPARGFDTGIINPRDGTYVQYEIAPSGTYCKIFYRQNDRMRFDTGGDDGGAGMKIIPATKMDISLIPKHLQNSPKVLAKMKGDRVEAAPLQTTGAKAVKGKFWGKGKLREVDYSLRLYETYVYA